MCLNSSCVSESAAEMPVIPSTSPSPSGHVPTCSALKRRKKSLLHFPVYEAVTHVSHIKSFLPHHQELRIFQRQKEEDDDLHTLKNMAEMLF